MTSAKRYTWDSIRGMVVTDDKISSRRWVRAEDYEKLEREAADALESAGELPEEPQTVQLLRKQNMVAPPVHHVVLTYIDTLRTAYSALAARLALTEGQLKMTFEQHDGTMLTIAGLCNLKQRAEQAELLNGLQAANITQLASELTQADSRIAELERDRDAWKEFAQHQECCAMCGESIASCEIGTELMNDAKGEG